METVDSVDIKKILHRIGLQHNLTDAEVRGIVLAQFQFAKELIVSGNRDTQEYNNFRLPMFGGFYVSKYKKAYNKRTYNEENIKNLPPRGGSIITKEG